LKKSLGFAVFLAALDQTIVSTALPAIASDFSALDQISWVATAYLLTMVTFFRYIKIKTIDIVFFYVISFNKYIGVLPIRLLFKQLMENFQIFLVVKQHFYFR
jgi:MFS family permease